MRPTSASTAPASRPARSAGYLFNIQFLRRIFDPEFELHWVRPTGPAQITTRWTMTMRAALGPLRAVVGEPQLVFTGTSIMGVDRATRRFCSHVDTWDSLGPNEQAFLSSAGARHPSWSGSGV